MPSLPLDVYQVLEEEYVSMYGPLPRLAVVYDAKQVLDAEGARDIFLACRIGLPPGVDASPGAEGIAAALNAIVTTDAAPVTLLDSPEMTARGRALLAGYDEFAKLAAECDPVWGVLELRRTIVDEAFRGAVRPLRDVRLDKVYDELHLRAKDKENPQPRTALCVSGGGIRSATFALGVIQGLASANILRKFDYLSTVSGGGYIGSWLSSWVRRHPDGVDGVEKALQRSDTAIAEVWEDAKRSSRDIPDSNIDPEPGPVRHLREYSNYMSPRLGLLSGDSWTIASTYVRNLLLNLLVLVPLLALALAIPRFFSFGLMNTAERATPFLPWIVVIFTTIAFGYIGAARPLERGTPAKPNRMSANLRYFLLVVLPLVIASGALALFWARVVAGKIQLTDPNVIRAGIGALAGMVLVPWAAYYGRMLFVTADARRSGFTSSQARRAYLWSKGFFELFAVSVALVTSAALFYLLAKKIFPQPSFLTPTLSALTPYERLGLPASPLSQLYVCFAIPAALLVFFVQASIFVGLSSRRNEDSDREWWGRGGALLLMTAAGLALFSFIAVFGPVALYHAPAILASIGGFAGIAAAVLGFSDKTPANQKQKEEGGTTAKLGNLGSALLVPFFVVFILAAIALGSTWLIHQIGDGGIDAGKVAKQTALTSEYSVTTRAPDGSITKNVMAAAPLLSLADLRATTHLTTIQQTNWQQLLAFLVAGGVALLLSLSIGVNKFSMHALYRNRLIRAYLGASRGRREPDAFTGFDESDNMQMWELRPELLWKTSIKQKFVDALVKPSGGGPQQALAAYLWEKLDSKTRNLLKRPLIDEVALDALAQNLNYLLIHEEIAVDGVQPPPWTVTDPREKIGYGRALRNRALLDAYFADDCIKAMTHPGSEHRNPLHVINTALNLTTGANIGWQQRQAESFTVTPFHSGSLYVGYRGSHEYGGAHGISLGTAVTISGAAASPNMGYHSSPAMAFLLTMFNVRLGSWLGNPGLHGQKSYGAAHPRSNLRPLIHELTGGSTDQSKWIYLSDGGHFENLGLYEMVLRRCHYIVVSDAGADPKFSFDDLGNAIRKIRTDLGVPIDLTAKMFMEARAKDGQFGEGRFVARATIRYSAVDENGEDGTLIYIKAGIYKNDEFLPRDVYNYAQESRLFPHEPTSDQFFSESQFESYRALGRHALNDICANYKPDKSVPETPPVRIPIVKRFPSIPKFDEAVRENLR